MSESNSTSSAPTGKPNKPYPDFPHFKAGEVNDLVR
jgi:hypothetical protein